MAKIGRTCTQCQGRTWEPLGDNDPTPIPCKACNSTGYETIGDIDVSDLLNKFADLEDKVNDILSKCDDIFEKEGKRIT